MLTAQIDKSFPSAEDDSQTDVIDQKVALAAMPSLEFSLVEPEIFEGSPYIPLSRTPSSSKLSIRTSIFAAEEQSTDMLVADLSTGSGVITPRILSRGSSRASHISTPSFPGVGSDAIRDYLESESGTIKKWLQEAAAAESDAEPPLSPLEGTEEGARMLHPVSANAEYLEEGAAVFSNSDFVMHGESLQDFPGLEVAKIVTVSATPSLLMPLVPIRPVEILTSEIREAQQTTVVHEEHSCLVAYRYRYEISFRKLRALGLLVMNPNVQHVDPDILETERERFAVSIIIC